MILEKIICSMGRCKFIEINISKTSLEWVGIIWSRGPGHRFGTLRGSGYKFGAFRTYISIIYLFITSFSSIMHRYAVCGYIVSKCDVTCMADSWAGCVRLWDNRVWNIIRDMYRLTVRTLMKFTHLVILYKLIQHNTWMHTHIWRHFQCLIIIDPLKHFKVEIKCGAGDLRSSSMGVPGNLEAII